MLINKITIEQQLGLSISSLLYLGHKFMDYSPKEHWKHRGIDGHSRNIYTMHEYEQIIINNVVNTETGKELIKAFFDEALEVFKHIKDTDRKFLKEYLGDKKIYFISGLMRTGCTYLMSELYKAQKINLQSLDMAMLIDRIPYYDTLYYHHEPTSYYQLLFELCQMIVWMKRELKESAKVYIKKHQAILAALPVYDFIFGDMAKYIITVRHPVPMLYSVAKMDNINLKEKTLPLFYINFKDLCRIKNWEDLNNMEKLIEYWRIMYTKHSQLLSSLDYDIIFFGKDCEKYVQNFNENYIPEKFHLYERDYSFDRKFVEKNIGYVRSVFDINNIKYSGNFDLI